MFKIKGAIKEMFEVRCPTSINKVKDDVKYVNDYENDCTTSNANETAFCGKCSRRNNGVLVSGLAVSLKYNTVIISILFIYYKQMLI